LRVSAVSDTSPAPAMSAQLSDKSYYRSYSGLAKLLSSVLYKVFDQSLHSMT
jgi:hypothetical protein